MLQLQAGPVSATFDKTADEAAESPTATHATSPRMPSKPQVTITPTSFKDAKRIGTVFRDGSPILLNLGELPDDDAKRLVDFAAGLIFQGSRHYRAGHRQGLRPYARHDSHVG
jgi:FtsZ-interacting cell division protein YlmF